MHIINDLINDALEFLGEGQEHQQMDTSEALELIERLASIDPPEGWAYGFPTTIKKRTHL